MTARAAVIGLGSRSTAYTEWMMCKSGCEAVLDAICDTDPERLESYFKHYFAGAADAPWTYSDHRKLLAESRADHIFISTPDNLHTDIALDAMRAGKHILLEKPIAANAADSRLIMEAARAHRGKLIIGFVLRYSPIYLKIKELIDNGEIGDLMVIEATESLGLLHGSSFFRRWHRFTRNSGGMMNTKCSHDMDLLNWLSGSSPKSISSFGALTHFVPNPGAAMKCDACGLASSCKYVYKREDYPDFTCVEDICVFNSEKDIIDHQTVNILFKNGATAVFTLSTVSGQPGRTMTVYGSKGTILANLEQGSVILRKVSPSTKLVFEFRSMDGHGGGDDILIGDFLNGERITNEAEDGFIATMTALAADKSMREGVVVDFDKFIAGGDD